jgi:acetyl-CoA carboxylase biotin carboxylase subunit
LYLFIHYASLIAKVIVRGRTHGEAIKYETRPERIPHYRHKAIIGIHLEVLRDPYFCSSDIDTQLISKRMSS